MANKVINLIHKTLNKFWTVQLEGETLTINSGANGSNGEKVVLTFKNSIDAENKLANLFLDRVVEGYEDNAPSQRNLTPKKSKTKNSSRTELSGLIKRQDQKKKIDLFAIPLELKSNKINIEVSSFLYNDFDPELDDYERVEVGVDKSSCEYEIKELKGRRVISLIQAQILFRISERDQRERFFDKDWQSEWIVPTLHVWNPSEETFLDYVDERLFTLELR